jgi:outer membrane PBP1 activator LpoA protein
MTVGAFAAPDVKDLSIQSEEKPSSFSWFWQPKSSAKETKEKATEKPPADLSAPVAKLSAAPHIALLLPLTGQFSSAALAIREGFIGAYYLDEANNQNTQTQINIYDTGADKNVIKAYNDALKEGANIIVGPLTKEGLKTLLDSKTVDNSTIVIALNTLEGRTHLPRYLYPFALGPEDEAYRLAEQAWHNGYKTAAGLVEKDTFGRRAAASFKKRFEQLGGAVVDIVYFDSNRALEDPVHYLLKVEEAKDAAGEMTFVRRRQDLDFIFLAANPQQARQIPPLMQFYYAKNLPIYAMASVYSGVPNPGRDNDLNGVVFCDSPWVVNAKARNSTLDSMAKQSLTHPDEQARLFAFGVDAFKVVKEINRLSASPQYRFNGATGTISMDSSGFIVREPDCARFSLGVPRVL